MEGRRRRRGKGSAPPPAPPAPLDPPAETWLGRTLDPLRAGSGRRPGGRFRPEAGPELVARRPGPAQLPRPRVSRGRGPPGDSLGSPKGEKPRPAPGTTRAEAETAAASEPEPGDRVPPCDLGRVFSERSAGYAGSAEPPHPAPQEPRRGKKGGAGKDGTCRGETCKGAERDEGHAPGARGGDLSTLTSQERWPASGKAFPGLFPSAPALPALGRETPRKSPVRQDGLAQEGPAEMPPGMFADTVLIMGMNKGRPPGWRKPVVCPAGEQWVTY